MPPSMKTFYNGGFLFGLHKNIFDKKKLRPVAVGGSWRRAFTSTVIKQNNQLFTEYLAPFNYAIGVKGGSNFVYHTTSFEINKYITRSTIDMQHNPPSPCLISMDRQNMFNKISRERALDIINTHFPQLSQIANTLLAKPTTCHYMEPNGEWSHFQQGEGLPQGCPFSPVLAALVLNIIIKNLDKQIRARAAQRKHNKKLTR